MRLSSILAYIFLLLFITWIGVYACSVYYLEWHTYISPYGQLILYAFLFVLCVSIIFINWKICRNFFIKLFSFFPLSFWLLLLSDENSFWQYIKWLNQLTDPSWIDDCAPRWTRPWNIELSILESVETYYFLAFLLLIWSYIVRCKVKRPHKRFFIWAMIVILLIFISIHYRSCSDWLCNLQNYFFDIPSEWWTRNVTWEWPDYSWDIKTLLWSWHIETSLWVLFMIVPKIFLLLCWIYVGISLMKFIKQKNYPNG